jgi:hypothetical protein
MSLPRFCFTEPEHDEEGWRGGARRKTGCGEGGINKARTVDGAAGKVIRTKPPEWQHIANQIDASFIATLAHFVSLDAHKQPDVPQKA